MTFDAHELERLRLAFLESGADDEPTSECSAPDKILAAVRDELRPTELRRVVGHVSACAVCTEAWRLAEMVESGEERDAEVPRPAGIGWRKGVSVLAAAALVVVVGLVVRQSSPGPEPVTREVAVDGLVLEVGTEPLPRDGCLLRWTAFEGARYNVVVSSEDLDIVAKAVDLDRPEYLVPEEALSGGRPVEPLLVYIEVHRPGEGTVASGTFPFRVR